MHPDTRKYNTTQDPAEKAICDLLAREIDKALQRWLAKSRDIQWDYKNITRRKGRLDRLK